MKVEITGKELDQLRPYREINQKHGHIDVTFYGLNKKPPNMQVLKALIAWKIHEKIKRENRETAESHARTD